MLAELHRLILAGFSRLSGWPRKLLALACLLLAALLLTHGRPRGSTTRDVVVAVHPIDAGSLVSDGDVRVVAWPRSLAPPESYRAVAEVVGHRAAGLIDATEAITRVRLLDNAVTRALHAGEVAVDVRLANGGHGLIGPGLRVDLYASPAAASPTDPDPPPARQPILVARGLRVLASGPSSGEDSSQLDIVVAIRRSQAAHLTISASGSFLATLVPPSQP